MFGKVLQKAIAIFAEIYVYIFSVKLMFSQKKLLCVIAFSSTYPHCAGGKFLREINLGIQNCQFRQF